MRWNWQQPDWPHFSWQRSRFVKAEERFLLAGGVFVGTFKHLDAESQDRLTVEAMTDEALTTSRIEGELLNRESVQSSIRLQLGLSTDVRRVKPGERGIGEVMVDLCRRFAEPLDHDTLCAWHAMIVRGRTDLHDVGRYRAHAEPMRVVSGRIDEPDVHFEAPPSGAVPAEMDRFIHWFNRTAPAGAEPLPALTRAGLAHLYFESIHPFEDGNGRVGRAIAEKAFAQNRGRASLTALSSAILARRKSYYDALEAANKKNEVTEWLAWFAAIAIDAQHRTLAQVEFLIDKARLFDRLRGRLNRRQEAALIRMFREGPEGFTGGLSAGNYRTITKAPAATATRDLVELVALGALTRSGERKGTRYHLAVPPRPAPRATIDQAGEVVMSKS